MEQFRRLNTVPPVPARVRVLCTDCRNGCARCEGGYRWVSPYEEGRGEQGEDFEDLREDATWD